MPEIYGRRVVQKLRGSDQYFTDTTRYTYYPVTATDASIVVGMGVWIDPNNPTIGHLTGWFHLNGKTLYSAYSLGTIVAPNNVTFSGTASFYGSFAKVSVSGKTVTVTPLGSNGVAFVDISMIVPPSGTKDSTLTVTQS